MALYLGNIGKAKIMLGDSVCYLALYPNIEMTTSSKLLSSDNYILKDSNNLYITVERSE